MQDIHVALIGLVIGSVASSIGFIYKKRSNDIYELRLALFRLLEVYGTCLLMRPVSTQKMTDWYMDVYREIFLSSFSSEQIEAVKAEALKFIVEGSKNNSEPSFGSVFSDYLEAIYRIAPISPVIAYSLSMNRHIESSMDNICRYRSAILDMCSGSTDSEIKNLNATFDIAIDREYASVCNLLRKDIRILSMRCGFFTFITIFKKMYFGKKVSIEGSFKEHCRLTLIDIRDKL